MHKEQGISSYKHFHHLHRNKYRYCRSPTSLALDKGVSPGAGVGPGIRQLVVPQVLCFTLHVQKCIKIEHFIKNIVENLIFPTLAISPNISLIVVVARSLS
jgi:hypothetical protein